MNKITEQKSEDVWRSVASSTDSASNFLNDVHKTGGIATSKRGAHGNVHDI
jgi:hypothetical protein